MVKPAVLAMVLLLSVAASVRVREGLAVGGDSGDGIGAVDGAGAGITGNGRGYRLP